MDTTCRPQHVVRANRRPRTASSGRSGVPLLRALVLLGALAVPAGLTGMGALAVTPALAGLPPASAAAVTEAAPPAARPTTPALRVPSPDWREQVIYFLMTDRFRNGDPTNDDQGAGEFDPQDETRYSGGDLRGVLQSLDYIQGLGATSVWLTPVVANQWWNVRAAFSGYHGYWAEDFSTVDAHLGTLADYRALSAALHGRGMYLVQDIVLNHTAGYFAYDGRWSPGHPERGFVLTPDSRGRTRPSRWPFNQNDARDAGQRAAAIYHWTPDIRDFGRRSEVLNFQLAGLDDLNTENPVVRRALRAAYGAWIRDAGVDGFRIDTAFHVPADFLDDFLHARDAAAPGIEQVARSTGRQHFLSFGEGFDSDLPYASRAERRIERYMRNPQGANVMPGMLNFPLYRTLGDVLIRKHATHELGWRIGAQQRLHARPAWMPTFLDNHDVERFLASGTERGLRQGLLALMTLPGIPVIYAGTEQGFTESRSAQFAGGVHSQGRDHFDPQAPLYTFLREVIGLRRSHAVFTHGTPRVRRDSRTGPGGLCWSMHHGQEHALIALNTAGHPVLLARVPTGLPPGTRLGGVLDLDGPPEDLVVDAHGQVNLTLPAGAGRVWLPAAAPRQAVAPTGRQPTIDALRTEVHNPLASLTLQGRASPQADVELVVDDDLSRPARTIADAGGHWRATLDVSDLTDATVEHHVLARIPQATDRMSAPRRFRVADHWQLLVDHEDPAGDDRGVNGRYLYPLDDAYAGRHLGDLRRVRVLRAGQALRIEVTMASLSTRYNPPNGFDHSLQTLFLGSTNRPTACTTMPRQDAQLPDGMTWSLRIRATGWSNILTGCEDADAGHEGRLQETPALLEVDAGRKRLRFTLAAALDRLDVAGLQVYVSTWDDQDGYSALNAQASLHRYGSGADQVLPRVLDDTPVLTLP